MTEPANLQNATIEQLVCIIAFRQSRANALQSEAAQAQRIADRARKELQRRRRAMKVAELSCG